MGNKRKLIDREIFFGNPEIAAGNISPDGRKIAFMKTFNGIMNIYVKDVDEDFGQAKVLTKSKTPILGYFWTRDSRYILYVNDRNGDENLNIFSVSPNEEWSESSNANLTPLNEVNVQIYKVSKKNPDFLWIGVNDRDKAWHDLYQLQISTKSLTLLYKNEERITGWEFDWDENVRLAYRTDENGHSEILRIDDDYEFELIYKTNLQESAYVAGWDEKNEFAYLVSNKGEVDLSTLYQFNVQNGETVLLESDPDNQVDFGSLVIHRHTKEILATVYVGDKVRRYWRNDDWQKMYDKFIAKFPNREISITSSTEGYEQFLISVGGDRYASETWLYDAKRDDFLFQYTIRPELKAVEDRLSPMGSIHYKSSDGLEISGYLTLPSSSESKSMLPCVVLIHGGPKGPRDYWGYDGEVQFLANRGYSVLQPNFRASGGFGKAFLNAGDKQWGKLMQDDITWGVKHLVEEGIVDPNRIGIMGGSYGGYATLAGLAFTPDLYACGVDIVGPSNLFTLLESIPPYWEAGRKWLYAMTGDPDTEEGRALLKASSPLFHSDRIIKPLLIVQGANDPRVKKAESDQIVEALKANNQPVTYLLAEDEGHGFRKPLNKMALHAEIEKFFATYLGGEYQEDVREDVKETLETLRQE